MHLQAVEFEMTEQNQTGCSTDVVLTAEDVVLISLRYASSGLIIFNLHFVYGKASTGPCTRT